MLYLFILIYFTNIGNSEKIILYSKYIAMSILSTIGISEISKRSISTATIISIKENKSLPIKKKINPLINARLNPVKIYARLKESEKSKTNNV